MMAKPVKTLHLHSQMIQFQIISFIDLRYYAPDIVQSFNQIDFSSILLFS